VIALVLLSAVLLDRLFSEPKCLHPLVGFGTIANAVESCLNNSSSSSITQLIAGIVSWALMVLIPTIVIVVVMTFTGKCVGVVWFFDIVFLYLAIGYTSLRQHAMAILTPLASGNLDLARQKLAWIVSRDTNMLSALDVRKATIESVLENGSDAIFAPIFWYVVGGLPAVIIYRLSNTLDAMWGYKTRRFLYFGRFSARMDDVLNYLPSRLVGLSYALCGNFFMSMRCWREQAHLLNSPNAGVVMTAGAGALDRELGGDAFYHGERVDKPVFGSKITVVNDDVHRALGLIDKTLVFWCMVIGALALLGYVIGTIV
jgi:adenosylcobinamide-phosphate synthase